MNKAKYREDAKTVPTTTSTRRSSQAPSTGSTQHTETTQTRIDSITTGVGRIQSTPITSLHPSEVTSPHSMQNLYHKFNPGAALYPQEENMDLLDLLLDHDKVVTPCGGTQDQSIPVASATLKGATSTLTSQGTEFSGAINQKTLSYCGDTMVGSVSQMPLGCSSETPSASPLSTMQASPLSTTLEPPLSTALSSPLSSIVENPIPMCQEPETDTPISDRMDDLDDIAITDLLKLIGPDTMDCVESQSNLNAMQLDTVAASAGPETQNPFPQRNESLSQVMLYSQNCNPVFGSQDLLSLVSKSWELKQKQGKTRYFKAKNSLLEYLKNTVKLSIQTIEIPWTLNDSDNELEILCSKVKDMMLTHYPQTMALKNLDIVYQQRKFPNQVRFFYMYTSK